MRNCLLICVGAVICCVLLAYPVHGAESAGQWAGSVTSINGILSVMNPAEPMLPMTTLEPRELWRIGDNPDDEEPAIGFVTDVLVDEQGDSYLLDSSFNVISVYAADGTFLRNIGREGEGPGEFQMATDFMFLPDGYIGVVQVMPAKVITLDRLGVPGKRFALCENDHGMSKIERVQSAGGYTMIGMMIPNFSANAVDHTLSFVDAGGRVKQTVLHESERQPGGSLNIGGNHGIEFTRYWSLGRDGHVYVARVKDEYKIEVYDSRGALQRVITREYETLRRSAAELAADKRRSAEMAKRFGGQVKLLVREHERDVKRMYARQDGELWVSSSRGVRDCPTGTVGLFDVFDSDGRYRNRVGIQVVYDRETGDY